jgi:membrane protein implicated in regulation of membrane protease activity
VSVRVSPISRFAAILIIVVGVITFIFVNSIAGAAFVVLGVVMYALLYRFRSKLESELRKAGG